MIPTPEELALYVMGEYDGDDAALEAGLDDTTRARLADEARLEMLLRDAAAAATFCPGCGDLVARERCEACGAAVRPGGYVVERVLVSNAHGRMYVARDADGKQVALKELAFVQAPSLAAIAAFERETKFLRALEHPAIPRFVASFEEGTGVHARYYLAQELVEGTSLEQRLDDHWFTEAEVTDVARQVLEVLVYLQALSPMVIHRDIKPANLIERDGKIAVVDFGAAHVQGATAGSTTIGTFGYMPIEQLAGQVDATTDGYALGATLLHLLSRQEPWKVVQSRGLDAINVSPRLRAFLAKLVAPEPRDRFADAKTALAALDAPEAVTAPAKPRRMRTWWRPLAFAAAALALVGGGAGGYALFADKSTTKWTSSSQERDGIATLRIALDFETSAELRVDDQQVATVRNHDEVPVAAGMREIEIVDGNGQRCKQQLRLAAGQTTMLECHLVQPFIERSQLPAGKRVSIEVKDAPLHDVLRMIAGQCDLGLVVPDSIQAKISLQLKDVPCDQTLEVVLQSHGLWYEFEEEAHAVRIAPRQDLDRESAARADREHRGIHDDPLPAGGMVDVDFANAPIHDLARMMAKVGDVNIVVPEDIHANVTMRMKQVPWNVAFQMMLRAHGLWYRFRPNGKLLRVAPRTDIDREYP